MAGTESIVADMQLRVGPAEGNLVGCIAGAG